MDTSVSSTNRIEKSGIANMARATMAFIGFLKEIVAMELIFLQLICHGLSKLGIMDYGLAVVAH